MKTFTTLLPIYNEADRLGVTLNEAAKFTAANPDFRLVFVDDGSTDGSTKILKKFVREASIPGIEVLLLEKNVGKGAAITKAWAHFPETDLAFTDGDLAYSLDHLFAIRRALEKSDVVIGSRSLAGGCQRNSSLRRKFLGWGFNRIACLVTGLDYKDTQAGLKGFRRSAAAEIFPRLRVTDFGFDVEILHIARKLGISVTEIPAHVQQDHSYKTSKLKLARDSMRMFRDLLLIRWNEICGRYK